MLMKKLFTSLMILAAAVTASAQNFSVTVLGQPVQNGETVTCGYLSEPSLLGGHDWDPEIFVVAGKSATYTVTATADAEVLVQFCSFGTTQCEHLGATPLVRSQFLTPGTKAPTAIDIIGGSITQPVTARISVTDGTETITFDVKFINEEQAGIDEIGARQNLVTISGRTLKYDINGSADITLYNISGRSVWSHRLSGTGAINLSNIPAGVYVYRAGNSTGKILLR